MRITGEVTICGIDIANAGNSSEAYSAKGGTGPAKSWPWGYLLPSTRPCCKFKKSSDMNDAQDEWCWWMGWIGGVGWCQWVSASVAEADLGSC